MDALQLLNVSQIVAAEGADISVYQWYRHDNGYPILTDPIDFHQMYDAGVRFAIVRATTILGEPDYAFKYNWQGLKEAGIVRGAYGFPNQANPAGFARKMYDVVAATGDLGELSPAMDYERLSMTMAAVETFLKALASMFGTSPLIYSNWNSWFKTIPPWINQYEKWVANWVTANAPTKMPVGWKSWAFWQNRIDATNVQEEYGVKSKEIDRNLFNGTLNQLYEKYHINIDKPQTQQAQIDQLRKDVDALEKRVSDLEGAQNG